MKKEDVRAVSFNAGEKYHGCLMDREIAGTKVSAFSLDPEETIEMPECDGFARILILIAGSALITGSSSGEQPADERDVCVQAPGERVRVTAKDRSVVVELIRELTAEESDSFRLQEGLPYFADYDKAPTYTEDCKSAKTVSRMLVPARIVPRFAMGSVQTSGDDMVEKHTHPMLEQFFFGMGDNNCTAMLDDLDYPFGADTLLHIPLGSDHGIRSEGDQTVHYYWMDFLFDEEGLAYMDSAHKINE